uniref:Putative ovule protein n=1 Tax=Solanum chacoense TaxID=4108 RepID=A0A0V0GZR4_SOLCH
MLTLLPPVYLSYLCLYQITLNNTELQAMLLGLFKNVTGCMSDPPKVVHFQSTRQCSNIFGDS